MCHVAWLVGQEPRRKKTEETESRKTEEETCGWVFGISIK